MTSSGGISVIIPLYNEAESIGPLFEQLCPVLRSLSRPYEVILVDDGSEDGTASAMSRIAGTDQHVRLITLRRNFGQTAALMAGIDHAAGEIIVPMDGDGQNDPADIPALLAKLEEGYDVVSGWRQGRQDAPIRRTLLSRIANLLISRLSGVKLHDYGCTLKAYRRDVLEDVRIYGEMHRFIPIYAKWQGARVTEMPVRHHARKHGRSNYGLERVLKVLLDLVVIRFLDRYASKPIYLFGSFGMLNLFGAVLAGLYTLWLKLGEGVSFIETPMPLLVVLFAVMGVTSVFMGLVAEMIMRTYFESQDKRPYSVKQTVNLDRAS